MSQLPSNVSPEPESGSDGGGSGDWRAPQPKKSGFLSLLIRVLVLVVLAIGLVLPFTPFAGKIKRGLLEIAREARDSGGREVIEKEVIKEVPRDVIKEVVKEVEVIKEVPVLPPLPDEYVGRKDVDIASLFNGITVKTQLITEQGNFASLERLDPEAYKAEFQLSIRVPKANQSVAELSRINEHLLKALPGLPQMLETGKVSPFYHKLYENKTRRVQTEVTRLNKALDRHNFFDCETILELTHPTTQRKVMLIQSEMDVVADGSDGDRMPKLDEYIYMSDFYQPFTSYAWAKKTTTPNPLLAKWEARLVKLNAEYAVKGLSAARNAELKSSISQVKLEISDLKARSSLIAEKDPFIVISLLFRGYEGQNAFTPGIGDYAAVVHGNKIYPAICGDYGPTFKMGEASLLMAKAVNEKATPYRRPESDLKVTYLIFPGTGVKPWGPPDLKVWEQKVTAYLNEVGGIGVGYQMHPWPDPFPKPVVAPAVVEPPVTPPGQASPVAATPPVVPPVTPAPAPTPAPTPAPAAPPQAPQ
jgi:hypothetical protein